MRSRAKIAVGLALGAALYGSCWVGSGSVAQVKSQTHGSPKRDAPTRAVLGELSPVERLQNDAEIKRSIRDLQAQEDMARATESIVRLTFWQIILGMVSVFGLSVTVFYAHQSAKQARRAVDVATDTAKRQLRAYVIIKSTHTFGVEAGGSPHIRVLLKNTGQTPATAFVAVGSIKLHPEQTRPIFNEPNFDEYPHAVIGSDVDHHVNVVLDQITKKEYDDILDEKLHITVRITGIYCDIFEEKHEFYFILTSANRAGTIVFVSGVR